MSDPTTTANEPIDDAGAAQPAGADAPGDDLAQVTRQRDDYQDQLLRARAEFANYQKRTKLQADADRQYLIVPLALDVLAAIDNFDRAIEAARAEGASGIVAGLDMVHKQLVGALAKHGVEPIAALGQPFDPNQHEAILQQPDADQPEGTVVAELVRGYKLKDRVLRPTKVAVSVR